MGSWKSPMILLACHNSFYYTFFLLVVSMHRIVIKWSLYLFKQYYITTFIINVWNRQMCTNFNFPPSVITSNIQGSRSACSCYHDHHLVNYSLRLNFKEEKFNCVHQCRHVYSYLCILSICFPEKLYKCESIIMLQGI